MTLSRSLEVLQEALETNKMCTGMPAVRSVTLWKNFKLSSKTDVFRNFVFAVFREGPRNHRFPLGFCTPIQIFPSESFVVFSFLFFEPSVKSQPSVKSHFFFNFQSHVFFTSVWGFERNFCMDTCIKNSSMRPFDWLKKAFVRWKFDSSKGSKTKTILLAPDALGAIVRFWTNDRWVTWQRLPKMLSLSYVLIFWLQAKSKLQ